MRSSLPRRHHVRILRFSTAPTTPAALVLDPRPLHSSLSLCKSSSSQQAIFIVSSSSSAVQSHRKQQQTSVDLLQSKVSNMSSSSPAVPPLSKATVSSKKLAAEDLLHQQLPTADSTVSRSRRFSSSTELQYQQSFNR
ncbi:hypothetical protein Peur_050837 [Populus x canadensis]